MFYGLFLLYAAFHRSGFLLLYANLAMHEAGHPLFGIFADQNQVGFGYTLAILGGTLLALFVPFARAVVFCFRREVPGRGLLLYVRVPEIAPLAQQRLPAGVSERIKRNSRRNSALVAARCAKPFLFKLLRALLHSQKLNLSALGLTHPVRAKTGACTFLLLPSLLPYLLFVRDFQP